MQQDTITANIWQMGEANRRRVCVIDCPGKTLELSKTLASRMEADLKGLLPETCQVRSLYFGYSETGQKYAHQIWLEVGEDPEDTTLRILEGYLKLSFS